MKSMYNRVAQTINSMLAPFGVRVVRTHSQDGDLVQLLKQFKVDTFLDVGANTGQTGAALRRHGYAGDIISFEPVSDAYSRLVCAAAGDAAWQVWERCAIGDHDGTIQMNVAGNSYSSSPLEMLTTHLAAAPESAYIRTEDAPLYRLDTLFPSPHGLGRIFLKSDTQGYDRHVYDGARGLLPYVAGVKIEASLKPLYEGETLFVPMHEMLIENGFRPYLIAENFFAPDRELLQVDLVFFR